MLSYVAAFQKVSIVRKINSCPQSLQLSCLKATRQEMGDEESRIKGKSGKRFRKKTVSETEMILLKLVYTFLV